MFSSLLKLNPSVMGSWLLLQIQSCYFSRNTRTSGSLKGCCSWVAKERQWLWVDDGPWGALFIHPVLLEGCWKLAVPLAREVLWCTVQVGLSISSSDLLCSVGGEESQRKFPSILFINFVSLTQMSLGMCSVMLDYPVQILVWLQEQCFNTSPFSVCVICSRVCWVQSARSVGS